MARWVSVPTAPTILGLFRAAGAETRRAPMSRCYSALTSIRRGFIRSDFGSRSDEHALLERRLDVGRVEVRRQLKRPVERPRGELLQKHLAGLRRRLRRRAPDHQHVVLDGHREALGLHGRQVHHQRQFLRRLVDVGRRQEVTLRRLAGLVHLDRNVH